MSKALGITDAVTTCDCCGKSNLKCTVEIELDGGEIVHYGRICASRNTGKPAKVINAEVAAEADRKRRAARAEFESSPQAGALAARIKEAYSQSIAPGRAFADFCRAAREAADSIRNDIAARHGLQPYQI